MKAIAVFFWFGCVFAAAGGVYPALPEPASGGNAAKVAALLERRSGLLEAAPVSVTFDKTIVAVSGDKRDYISVGIYWWPNEATESGLPYIRRDGVFNPDAAKSDSSKIARLCGVVTELGILYHFTKDEEVAAHAVKFLRTFFTDPETGVKPHLRYAQSIPGICDGRAIGIIDALHLIDVADCIVLLKDSNAMSREDYAALLQWFREYRDWMASPAMRQEFEGAFHNIWIAYHAQIIAHSIFIGDMDTARGFARDLMEQLPNSIMADGRMPLELGRTKSWDYSIYALDILFRAVSSARNAGVDMLAPDTESGKRIRAALDYLIPYTKDPAAWPYEQLYGQIQFNSLAPSLMKMYFLSGEKKYFDAYSGIENPRIDLITDLFFTPDL